MSLEEDVHTMIQESLMLIPSLATPPETMNRQDAATLIKEIVVPICQALEQGILRVARAVDELEAKG